MARPQLSTQEKHRIVARCLHQGMSEVDAYKEANYAIPKTLNALRVNAHKVCTHANVLLILKELDEKADSVAIMSVVERKERLSQLGRADLTDFVVDGEPILNKDIPNHTAVSEYSLTYTKSGEPKKTIKLHDPVRAIQELNKMEKVYSDSGEGNTNNQYNIIILNSVDDKDGCQQRINRVLSGDR